MENQTENTDPKPNAARRPPLFAMAFLYILGFFIINKSGYDSSTGLGLAMIIFGWVCMLLAIFLAVAVLFRLFKEQFNKR